MNMFILHALESFNTLTECSPLFPVLFENLDAATLVTMDRLILLQIFAGRFLWFPKNILADSGFLYIIHMRLTRSGLRVHNSP